MDKYMEHTSTAFEKGDRDSCEPSKEKVFQELNWDFHDVEPQLFQCLRILGTRIFPGPEDKPPPSRSHVMMIATAGSQRLSVDSLYTRVN
jgi:hypothetical protein